MAEFAVQHAGPAEAVGGAKRVKLWANRETNPGIIKMLDSIADGIDGVEMILKDPYDGNTMYVVITPGKRSINKIVGYFIEQTNEAFAAIPDDRFEEICTTRYDDGTAVSSAALPPPFIEL